jgi:predicted ATPase/DNA-binding winged helix-turn-helix (wHTH) protein
MTMGRFGEFRLDSVNECLWRRHPNGGEERIQLPPKAYAVLSLLVRNAGRLVAQDELLDAVWPGTHIQPEGLKNQILHLRRVLGDDPRRPRFIETLPRRGYRFIGTDTEGGPTTTVVSPPGGRLVAREPELALLDRAMASALDGRRQVIFVSGEPGIGKSALVEAFGERSRGAVPELVVARGQCVEGFGGKDLYYPILDALDAYWRQHPEEEGAARDMLATPGAPMLREVREILEAIATRRPLLLVLEDLQWVDQASVDVLAVLARGRAPCRLLVIGTCRAEHASVPNRPLKMLRQELLLHGLAREIALEPLPAESIAEFVCARRGDDGGMDLALLLHRQCGGNPLFMSAALEDLHRRGLVVRRGNGWRMNAPSGEIVVSVPERVRHMIEAHIDDMPDDERQVLEAASVVGASFHGSAAAAAAQLSREFIEDTCERLSASGRILRGAADPRAYEFVHGFYRDVLYQRQPAWQRAAFLRRVEEHEKVASED